MAIRDAIVNRTQAGTSKNVALIVSVIATFCGSFLGSAVNVALPTISKEFAMEAVLLGWVNTGLLIASAAFLIPMGRLADIYGRRKMLLYGTLLNTVSSFLCAISGSATSLISYRVLQGISMGMLGGTSVAILTSVFPAEERGKAFGINVASVYLGLSLGPFLGGMLTQYLGWRSIFYLAVLLGLVVAALIFWKLRGEWADARGERVDVIGSVVIGVSLVVIIYGFTMLPAALGIILVVVGLLGLAVFVWWEARTASPVFAVGLFRKNTAFIFSNLATLINYSATSAVSYLLSLYLQYTKGLSPQTAGLVLLAQPVVMTIFAPLAGRLSDRVEARKIASVGMAFSVVALAMFVFLGNATTFWYIIAALAILGFGTGLFASPNTNVVMGSVEKRFFGVASGVMATMRTVGMNLGMGVTMILFSLYIGDVQITPEYYPAFLSSVKVGFVIFAALCFGGIFAQLAVRKSR
jgi:EmrB/QacA subfamily drug resistance transporter